MYMRGLDETVMKRGSILGTRNVPQSTLLPHLAYFAVAFLQSYHPSVGALDVLDDGRWDAGLSARADRAQAQLIQAQVLQVGHATVGRGHKIPGRLPAYHDTTCRQGDFQMRVTGL